MSDTKTPSEKQVEKAEIATVIAVCGLSALGHFLFYRHFFGG